MAQSVSDYGPLALQLGGVTSAVDDLVHGYEHLVHTLPDLTSKITSVHADAEQMAKELEHRTRSMVDGYEYLQGLSTQLPEMFRETAAAHRKTLQEAIHLLTPEEQAMIAEQEKVLAKVRGELQSISHERVIMDVIMRPVISETKRLHTQRMLENEQVLKKRYTMALGERGATNEHHAATASRAVASTLVRPEGSTVVSGGTVERGQQHRGGAARPQQIAAPAHPAIDSVRFERTAELLSTPIHIPVYDPAAVRNAAAAASAAAQRSASASRARGLGGYLSHPDSATRQVVARAVGGSLMVPAMKKGALPEELQGLKTVPTAAVTAADYMSKQLNRQRRTRRRIKSQTIIVEQEPLAKSLQEKLSNTEEEIRNINMRLAAGRDAFGKDQSKAIKKLEDLVKQLQAQQGDRDEALLAAVQKLLQEALSKRAGPNLDAQILKALEALLIPPQRVAVIDRLHEYKVLVARPKTPVPVRNVPVIMPVAKPAEEEKPKCVEVQTEPLPAPPAPAPAPVAAPQAPQPIVINLPAPPAAPPAPAAPGVERELIELVRSVVDTQHQTMQGNQALILSLIHERHRATPVQEMEEAVEEVPQTPPRAPTPEPEPAPLPAPVVQDKFLPGYSTALGQVLLGAELMCGPYETAPTIVPSGFHPCELRGVPVPKPRRVSAEQPSGPLHASSDPEGAPAHTSRRETEVRDLPSSAADEPADGRGIPGPVSMVPFAAAAGEVGESTAASATAAGGEEAAAGADAVTAFTEPDLPAAEEAQLANIGLQGSGTGSTSGRGGALQHTAPGVIHRVDPSSIPPHMRRVASKFTMRALHHPYRGDTEAEQAAQNKSTPTPAPSTEAPQPVQAGTTVTVGGGTVVIHTASSQPVASPASAVTPEFIAQQVKEGVERGVKEALGLMDTHARQGSTYYSPGTSQHSNRHGKNSKVPAPNTPVAQEPNPSHSQVIMLSATDKPDDAVRESLTLLKSRRSCGRSTRAVTDKCGRALYAERTKGIIFRNEPHHYHRQLNDIRTSEDWDRETYGAPKVSEAARNKAKMDAELQREIAKSRTIARKLVDADENSSFNDSVSLDEETAAHLRDPLTYNLHEEVGASQDSTSDISIEEEAGVKTLHIVHRDELTKRQKEIFSDRDDVPVRTDLASRRPAAAPAPAPPTGAMVPLVSRVLSQSATEEVLERKGRMGAFTVAESVDSADYYGETGRSSVDADAALWDMDVSVLGAPAAASATAAPASEAMSSGLKLLKQKGPTARGPSGRGRRSPVSSPGSSVSIVTRSSSSSDSAASLQDIPQLEGTSSSPPGPPSGPVRMVTELNPGSRPSQGRAVNPHYSPRSSESSSDGSLLAYKQSGRPSLLPRYSYSRPSPERVTSASRRRQSSRSRERARHAPVVSADAAGSEGEGNPEATEKLAAQLMLNVLELQQPHSYVNRPHLANPIRRRHHSTLLAASSSDADSTAQKQEDGDGSRVEEEGSGLDCTGSTVTSGGEMLDGSSAAAVGYRRGGAHLLGLNKGAKLLSIRKYT